MKRPAFFAAVIFLFSLPLFPGSAFAQRMLNISAAGDATTSDPLVACTIIRPEGRELILYFIAEAVTPNTDPYLVFEDLSTGFEAANASWIDHMQDLADREDDPRTVQQVIEFFEEALGRSPNNPTDAALSFTFTRNTSVCIFGYQEFVGEGEISLQITDITDAFKSQKSSLTGVLSPPPVFPGQ